MKDFLKGLVYYCKRFFKEVNMLTKIKLFFTMKEFRTLVIMAMKDRIWSTLTFPFRVLKEYFELKKINDIPDRWGRFVKLREKEKKDEYEKLRNQIAGYVCNAIGSVTRMVIMMQIAFSSEYLENYSEAKTQASFDEEKSITIETMKQMELLGKKIPNELWELVENCQLRSYTSSEEISKFGDTVRNMLGEIRF